MLDNRYFYDNYENESKRLPSIKCDICNDEIDLGEHFFNGDHIKICIGCVGHHIEIFDEDTIC